MSLGFQIQNELLKMNLWNNSRRIKYLSTKHVIYKFKNKNIYSEGAYLLNNFIVAKKLKKDMNGFTLWKNEITSLMKVNSSPYFPSIVAADPNNLIIYMTYCGKSLEEVKHLPINWLYQFNKIKNILYKKGLNPNDILTRNICILDNTIKIIDFGLANGNFSELNKSMTKLEYILKSYSN
jgi:tRNA A-37 threonylcarbamoyl transferase component Bud32